MNKIELPPEIEHLQLQIEDHEDESISELLIIAFNFIDRNINLKKNVLVHCVAGISRSAAFLVYYFMKKENLNFEKAYDRLALERPFIKINQGFIKTLK